MEFVNEVKEKRILDIREVLEGEYKDKGIRMDGVVHTICCMGEVVFVILRRPRGLAQYVYEVGIMDSDIRELEEGSAVEVMGVVKIEERVPQGFETRLKETRVLSRPTEPLPLAVSKWKLSTSLEARLSLRPTSLRNVQERAKFKTQEGIVRGFRGYLLGGNFTEIRTPKIAAKGVEGSSNVFKLEYFNKKAELGQGPQSHKQTIVGAYDRVFEAVLVFQAEKHNTTRHLNEYTSLDFRTGYIDSLWDVVDMEAGMSQYVVRFPEQDYKKGLDILGVTLPEAGRIPAVRSDQAEELASRKYGREICNPYDLEPEEELLIGRYFQEEYGGGFVFVTHHPPRKRPFYVMGDPADPRFTLSSDLLFRGLEVIIGGQRIHDYKEIAAKMEKQGMDPKDIASYPMIFRYGTPPHDGLSIGLKRLTMRLLDGWSIRKASLFPGDAIRLES